LFKRLSWAHLTADLVKSIVGNCCTIINRNFFRVLVKNVQFQILQTNPNLNRSLVFTLAVAICKFALGRKGVPDKNRGDEDDEGEEEIVDNVDPEDGEEFEEDDEIAETDLSSVKAFKSCIQKRVASLVYKKNITISAEEQELITSLEGYESIQNLRNKYLPEYLLVLCDEWQRKLTEKKYGTFPLVWRMFGETNISTETMVQHIHPGSKTGPKSCQLTNTRLAVIWCTFLKKHSNDKTFNSWIREREYKLVDKLTESAAEDETESYLTEAEVSSQRDSIFQGNYKTILKGSDQWGRSPDLLWRTIFPGIFELGDVRSGKLRFQYSGRTNGLNFRGMFANPNSFTASSKTTDDQKGYNSKSWRSRLPEGKSKINIADLAGTLDADKMNETVNIVHQGETFELPKFGGSCNNKNFHGKIYIDGMVKKGECETGLEAAKELFNDRSIMEMDAGFVLSLGVTVSEGKINEETNEYEGKFKRYKMSSKGRYQNSGIDDHLAQRQKRDNENEEIKVGRQHLYENNCQMMDPTEYQKHIDAVNSDSTRILMDDSWSMEKLKALGHRDVLAQRFWSNFKNNLLAIAESNHREYSPGTKMEKAPVLIFGDGSFATMRGQRATCPSKILDYLSRFFLVIVVGEHNSSQKCPKCWEQMDLVKNQTGYRLKYCKGDCRQTGDVSKRFIVHRDISAPINMLSIVISLVWFGFRPEAFAPKKQDWETEDAN